MAVKSLIEGIAEDATAPIAQIGGRLIVTAALSALAIVSAAAAAVFLTSALYTTVERVFGGLEAMLAVGGLYLVVAAGFAVAVFLRSPARSSTAMQTSMEEGARMAAIAPLETARSDAAASGGRESELGRSLERLALPVLDLLREQGMERERVALAAAVMAAKEMRPWMLVGLSMVVGVAVGSFARTRYKPRAQTTT